MKNALLFTLLILFLTAKPGSAQPCSTLNIEWEADIASTCDQMTMTMIHDALDRPYLYVANKEAGLVIYNITDISNPTQVNRIPTSLFKSLHVMNLSQQGNYLYLAIGNFFTNSTAGGMAIIDITNPEFPVLTDYFVVPNSDSGGGIVKVEGDYAYLGAMQSGLVILDISDKNNIQFISQFIPDINYPPVFNPNPNMFNARGMEVRNSIVYLCYDAGGLRIINCTDKNHPVETGHWCNPAMYTPINHPKAYNNCVLDDSLLYVAVDYAGLEVLNVADTANIKLLGWWNPNGAPNANWFTCRIHTNEIRFNKECKHIFLSDGKSDMHVIDVTNPAMPDSCNYYGGIANNIGTWGIGLWKDQIYLSYICTQIPFSSDWTGVKILTYERCKEAKTKVPDISESIVVFPNPFSFSTTINIPFTFRDGTMIILNSMGIPLLLKKHLTGKSITLDRENLLPGLYFIQLYEGSHLVSTKKIIVR